jgi:prophage DNA circulation protein
VSLIEQTLPASYKGVPFLVTSSSITGGQKTVKHVFPNSSTQVIEDLGKSQRIYNIQALIQASSEDTYLQERDRLLAILEQGGTGKLTHPFYGNIENVKVTTYTIVEDFTNLGEGRINVTFEISTGSGIPVKAQNTVSEINNLNESAKILLSANFIDSYVIGFPSTYTQAVEKLNQCVTAFSENTSFFQADADSINAFALELSSLESNITSLANSPQELFDSINNMYLAMGNIYPTTQVAVDSLKKFFIFGNDDTSVTQNTSQRIERVKTLNIVNHTIQAFALLDAYFNAAQIDFYTVADVETVANDLDECYQNLIASDVLSFDFKDSLTDIRTRAQEFFDQQKLTAQQIITVNTNRMSSSLLAFQYYGESSKSLAILKLNNIVDPSSVEGDIEIFTK